METSSLNAMKMFYFCYYRAGGPWLITDMRRGESLFEHGPSLQEKVDQGIETEGSNLSGVNSKCSWEEPGENDRDNLYDKDGFDDDEDDAERGHLSILGNIRK